MTEYKPKKPSRRTLQKNRKAREHARQNSLLAPIMDVDNESAEPTSPTPMSPALSAFSEAPPRYSSPMIRYPSNIIRKPSTVGSASVYSTQSGEERHMSANVDLLKAALGAPGLGGSASISHKPSNISSVYSSQSGEDREYSIPSHTAHPSQRRLTGWTPSMGSIYSAGDEQQQLPSRPRIGLKGNVGTPSRLSQFSYHSPNELGVAYEGEAL
ncbi:hypothetical protein HWV62_17650 [Athelia sp. TMB]|nr:hypothetical protein HWV62_17650 [Athelia sp. TMB]